MLAPSIVALIPARAGSKRVQGKNIRTLAGHPLIAYTIAAAVHSQIFADVIVSTDSDHIADIACYYGAKSPFLRPDAFAGDASPDIDWVDYTLRKLRDAGQSYDCFSILRPTSPLRQPETIQRAWKQFQQAGAVDSLRAVEKCKQHPGKMWVIHGDRMTPLLLNPAGVPWHSTPYQSLPEVYVQNASLEIARASVVFEHNTIAGTSVIPFFTQGLEGFDINDPRDWALIEALVDGGKACLPRITQPPYPSRQR